MALSQQNELYFWGRYPSQPHVNPKKIELANVKDIAAVRGCSVSVAKTTDGKIYFWGFAYGHLIPEPILTTFSSMDEVFASLDSPMMLKPVQPGLRQPALGERLGASFDDEVKWLFTHA